MKNFQRGFGLTFLLVILAIVIVAGGAYWYVQNMPQTASVSSNLHIATSTSNPIPTPSTTNQQLKTYTNSQYGFSLQYPADFTPKTDTTNAEWWGLNTPPLFLLVNNTNFAEQVSVGVSQSLDDCEIQTNTSPVMIDGVEFYTSDGSDPAAGQEGLWHTYAGIKNSLCYRIVVGFVGEETSHIDTQAGKDAELANEAGTFKTLDSIVESLTFTQPAAVSVSGMSKYTDSSFGFSFWYPSEWNVSKSIVSSNDFAGATSLVGDGLSTTPSLTMFTVSNGIKTIILGEINSQSSIHDVCGKCNSRIYFDATTHQWMDFTGPGKGPGGSGDAHTDPADVSVNTMGGLHIIWDSIVPLSATNFVVVDQGAEATIEPLTKTIVATDPSVATPVSVTQQQATIQAEKDAYANQ